MKSVFIFCGESSADLHGSNLAKALFEIQPNLEIHGVGGPLLRDAGVSIFRDNADLSVVGFWEVVKQIRTFKVLLNGVTTFIQEKGIDTVILIDYSGFNLRLAPKLKSLGLKIYYYISPQVWAWRKKRVETIKRCVDHMMVIFEFEKEIYEKAGVSVTFVGHPFVDRYASLFQESRESYFVWGETKTPLISFFPGSREAEIKHHVPVFLEAIVLIRKKIPDAQFVISAGSKDRLLEIEILQKEFVTKHSEPLVLVSEEALHPLMKKSSVVVVASGTASLEAAIHARPLIVVYKMNALSYLIIASLVQIKQVAMANLVAGKTVVPELVQFQVTSENIFSEVMRYFENEEHRNTTIQGLLEIRKKLGDPGASKRAAEVLFLGSKE